MSDNDGLALPDFEQQPAGGLPVASASLMADGEDDGAKDASDLATVADVPVNVSAVLGRTQMNVASLMRLGPGTVLELDRKVGEAIDIYVNNRLVARGEIVIVEERLGVTMTEIIKDNGAG
jgi:flagellar motor switch protein FliN/FliY